MLEIINYMNELFDNPKCELKYNKDYELLIAVMLSAQTTDKRVNEVTTILFKKYPTLEELSKQNVETIENIIRPLGTYHIKAKNIISIANQLLSIGYVPNDRSFLESLDGVGRKTTNVVLMELYNEKFMAVDTHVERVSKRLKLCKENDSVRTIEKKLMKKIPEENIINMHHQLVLFGRYYCKAKNPKCDSCKLKSNCKYNKKRV